MLKLIKWVFGLLVLLVVLIVGAAVILPMVIDPNDYKPQIVDAAQQQLGRELAIEQDLRLSVFPWLGIETGGVRVGNAAGFEADAFAEVDRLGVKVKLLPLLSSRVEVDTLVLKGLRVNLEKDAKGHTNWDDLAGGPKQEQSAPDETAAEPSAASGQVAFSIQGVQIEDARITWDDRQAGQQYELDGVRLVTGALAPGATVPVEAGVTFTSAKPAMTLKAALEASVSSDAALARFDIAGLILELDASGEGLPANGAQLTLKADVAADLQAGTVRVAQLQVTGPAMSASGEVSVEGMQGTPAVSGRLAVDETNPKTLASMFAVPIETTDPKALTRASGDLAFRFSDGALQLDPLTLGLDDSKLTGHVHLPAFDGPVVRTRLDLDRIDLDRYMPPPAADAAARPADAGDTAASSASADPFAALRTLDLVGEFSIGELTVAKARMQKVTAKVTAKKGVLKVEPMAANLYQGTFSGNLALDASGKTPKLATRQKLDGVQVGALLADVAGQDTLQGRGEFEADLRLVGMSEAEIRRSLNGTSRFAFRDGALKGVNIAQIIRDASGALGLGGDRLDTGTPGQTDFSELSGSVRITNGVVKNDDLAAKSPLLRIEGKGEVDLPRDTIDYVVVTKLVGSLEGQGGKGHSELGGIPIPVRITGPLTAPKYQPDLEAALSAKAKAQLEEKKEELRGKVEEKVKGQFGDALKGLFK